MNLRKMIPTSVVAATGLLAGSMAGAATVGAQGTPEPEVQDATDSLVEIVTYPVHIHAGTCDDLGDVVFPLNDLEGAASMGEDDTDALPVDISATPDATSELTAQSSTDVDASLDDILTEPHAINVHESADNMQNFIACGDITGEPEDGTLSIDLNELNDSGFTGEVELSDQGEGTTIVHASLFPMLDEEAPEATPAS